MTTPWREAAPLLARACPNCASQMNPGEVCPECEHDERPSFECSCDACHYGIYGEERQAGGAA